MELDGSNPLVVVPPGTLIKVRIIEIHNSIMRFWSH